MLVTDAASGWFTYLLLMLVLVLMLLVLAGWYRFFYLAPYDVGARQPVLVDTRQDVSRNLGDSVS